MRISPKYSKRRVFADEDIDVEVDAEDIGGVDIAPEASDLLFEANDVAELVAEITGDPVEVTVDEDSVTFAVGDAEYKVEPEGDEEVLEASRRNFRGKKPVKASRSVRTRRPVKASHSVRRVGSRRTVR